MEGCFKVDFLRYILDNRTFQLKPKLLSQKTPVIGGFTVRHQIHEVKF